MMIHAGFVLSTFCLPQLHPRGRMAGTLACATAAASCAARTSDCHPVRLCVLPDRKEGLLIEGICRSIPWDKVLNVASPDGGAHACWQSFGHPPAVRCVILPGET